MLFHDAAYRSTNRIGRTIKDQLSFPGSQELLLNHLLSPSTAAITTTGHESGELKIIITSFAQTPSPFPSPSVDDSYRSSRWLHGFYRRNCPPGRKPAEAIDTAGSYSVCLFFFSSGCALRLTFLQLRTSATLATSPPRFRPLHERIPPYPTM